MHDEPQNMDSTRQRGAETGGMRGLTFELTGPLRWDGLARAGKMYRVPQAGPRQPAVGGPVVQRGVRRRWWTRVGKAWCDGAGDGVRGREQKARISPPDCWRTGG